MTDLVHFLLLYMIPIDFKITNFSLHLYSWVIILIDSEHKPHMPYCSQILFYITRI